MVSIGTIDEAGHMACPYCEQVIGIPSVSSDPALRELMATRLMLESIEAHMVNERGLRGVDHADEGRRIRAALQALLAIPSLAVTVK